MDDKCLLFWSEEKEANNILQSESQRLLKDELCRIKDDQRKSVGVVLFPKKPSNTVLFLETGGIKMLENLTANTSNKGQTRSNNT